MELGSFANFLDSLSVITRINFLVMDKEGVVFPFGYSNWKGEQLSEFCNSIMAQDSFGHALLESRHQKAHLYGYPLKKQEITIGCLIAVETIKPEKHIVEKDSMANSLSSLATIIENKWSSDLEIVDYIQEITRNFEESYLYSKISTHMKSIGLSHSKFIGIFKEIFRVMDVDLAFIIMPDYPHNNEIQMSSQGSQKIEDPVRFIESLIDSLPMEGGSIEQLFFIINESDNDPVYRTKHPDPFRFLAVMIKRNDNFYGWLGFLSFNVSAIFVNSELNLLKSIAASAAVAIENSNLYAESIIMAQKEGDLRRKFQKYVPEMVVEEILGRDINDIIHMVEPRHLTLLNVDIRGYSKMSKIIKPENIVVAINIFFKIMGKIVLKHKGTIDKYLGDGLLAIFGAPLETPHPEMDATLAAMEMVSSLSEVNQCIQEYGVPINIGVSIHTGVAIAGNIGFENKMEYTVIGDMVNDTFRLQDITKEKMNSIMISNAVYEKVAPYILVRPLGERQLGEKENQMKVFEVTGRKYIESS